METDNKKSKMKTVKIKSRIFKSLKIAKPYEKEYNYIEKVFLSGTRPQFGLLSLNDSSIKTLENGCEIFFNLTKDHKENGEIGRNIIETKISKNILTTGNNNNNEIVPVSKKNRIENNETDVQNKEEGDGIGNYRDKLVRDDVYDLTLNHEVDVEKGEENDEIDNYQNKNIKNDVYKLTLDHEEDVQTGEENDEIDNYQNKNIIDDVYNLARNSNNHLTTGSDILVERQEMVKVSYNNGQNNQTENIEMFYDAVKHEQKNIKTINNSLNIKNCVDDVQIIYSTVRNRKVSGFSIGGEARLCLPELLNLELLEEFPENYLIAVCEKLNIKLTRCDRVQLDALKKNEILPANVHDCGLIKYSDVEHLCSILLNCNNNVRRNDFEGIRLCHECFGGCEGILIVEENFPVCIQCVECKVLLSSKQFVSHSHSLLEVNTEHWGFDSEKWDSYILVSMQNKDVARCQAVWEEMKFNCMLDNDSKYMKMNKVLDGIEKHDLIRKKDKRREEKEEKGGGGGGGVFTSDLELASDVTRKILEDIKNTKSSISLPSHIYLGDPVLEGTPIRNNFAERYTDKYVPNVSLSNEPFLAINKIINHQRQEVIGKQKSCSDDSVCLESCKNISLSYDDDDDDDYDDDVEKNENENLLEREEIFVEKDFSPKLEILMKFEQALTVESKKHLIDTFYNLQRLESEKVYSLLDKRRKLEKNILEELPSTYITTQ